MRDAIRLSQLLSLTLVALAQSQTVPAPQTDSVEPRMIRAGSIVTVKGLSLSKDRIDEVYLTDHRFDLKVKVLTQGNSELTFRVPPFVKPGRLQLLYLTAGATPTYLEQPFFVQILDAEESLPATATPITSTAPPRPAPVEVASTSPKPPVVAVAPKPEPPPPAPVSAPPPQTAIPVREVIPAKLVKRTSIALSNRAMAEAAKFGEVHLIALVRADGTVKQVKIVKGHPLLAQAAAMAVREWTYQPARVDGQAVESEVPVLLNLHTAGH